MVEATGGKVHLIMAVWGKPYLDLFLELSLPCQLAPGNLPALKNRPGVTYKIYTTIEGEAYLRRQEIFQRLTELIDTKIIAVDSLESDDKFSPLINFHNQAIREADAENAALIFLSPDFIIADGTLLKLIELWHAGHRAVLVLTLRLVKETFKEELQNTYYRNQDHVLQVAPRDLVGLGLKHLHPTEKSYFWGSRFSSFPIHAYWPVNDEGIVARCYYLHPLLVNPRILGILPQITIDADYVERVCSDYKEIFVVRDSDELAVFELTPATMDDANAIIRPSFPATAWNYARWAVVNANPFGLSFLHHRLFQIPIRIHSGDFSLSWGKHERASEKTARWIGIWSSLLKGKWRITEIIRFLQETMILSKRYDRVIERHNIALSQVISKPLQSSSEKYRWLSSILGRHNLTYDIEGSGWGEVEWNASGQRWRWIGSEGKARLFLKLKHKKDYILKTHIHTALGRSLDNLNIEVNGQASLNQHIFSEKGRIWHCCILPATALTHSDGNVEIVYNLADNSDGHNIALSHVISKPLQSSSEKYRWLSSILGRHNLTYDIEGTGWGEVEWNASGQRWRWIGSGGKARLFLKLKHKKDYILKTHIHTALEQSLDYLNVEVNGQTSLHQHKSTAYDGKIWHYCILPASLIAESKGEMDIIYRISKDFKNKNIIAITQVICRPLILDPIIIRAIINKIGVHIRGGNWKLIIKKIFDRQLKLLGYAPIRINELAAIQNDNEQLKQKNKALQQDNEQIKQKSESLHQEFAALGIEKESLIQERNNLCLQLDEFKELQVKEWHEKFNFLLRTHEEAATFVNIFVQGALRKHHKSVSWGDRLLTMDKTAGFWEDQKFVNAYNQIKESQAYDQYSGPDGIAWRLNTLVWAAKCAVALPGDFVECGVFKGDMSWVVANVMDWGQAEKTFYLYDTFEGFSSKYTSLEDFPFNPGFLNFANSVYQIPGLYEQVRERFKMFPNVKVIQGILPDALAVESPKQISFLHIDLNSVKPEIGVLEVLFDRVVSGGIVIFDDYGWLEYVRQKRAEDAFMAARGHYIMELPTGQGLVVKR